MAEATLFVPATARQNEAKIIYVDRDQLNAGHMVIVDEDAPNAVAQVSCGQVATSQWAVIVDPEARTEQADGDVGEIWLHGLNIGKGYWNKVGETEATFHNKLADRLASGSHADGVGRMPTGWRPATMACGSTASSTSPAA